MRAFLWAGVLAAAACGEVVQQQQQQPDAAVQIDASNNPRVETVTPPASVEGEGGTGMVTATLAGPPNTELIVAFAGTLGTFVPPSTNVTTNASGKAMVMTTYTAGPSTTTDMTEMATLSITSPSGATPKSFEIPIVAMKRQGNTTEYNDPSSFSPNYLLGEPITTTVSGKLKKLGFIYGSAGAMVRVGIYTNNASNQPGTLVAELPATAAAQGSWEVALATPVDLPAGTYWFLGLHDVNATIKYTNSSTNNVAYISLPFGNPLPTTFPSPSMYTGQSFNWWFVIGQ